MNALGRVIGLVGLLALCGCERSPQWVLWADRAPVDYHDYPVSEHRTLAGCQDAAQGYSEQHPRCLPMGVKG